MAEANDSWADPAQELMADWNLDVEEDAWASMLPPDPPDFLLTGDGQHPEIIVADSLAEESFPDGSTALCRAFRPAPSKSESFAQGSASAGAEISDQRLDDAASECAERPTRPAGNSSKLPRLGEELKGFRLVMELGRGAFARVFLAEEASLGNRLVAVKISRAEGQEPQMLARLLHTNIVPVHSVQDDPDTGLRILCMPFLGGANLAQLLQEAWGLAHAQATGRSLVEALDQFSHRLPPALGKDPSLSLGKYRRSRSRSRSRSRTAGRDAAPISARSGVRPVGAEEEEAVDETTPPARAGLGQLIRRLVGPSDAAAAGNEDQDAGLPARRFLRTADNVRAAVWIVAHLAEGLDHAHNRGLLHRDLKPANILIAADGTPMLLDFNLAAETEQEAEAGSQEIRKAMLGGTLPYMAPEHLDAFDPEGNASPEDVDERSDIYALGLILFEMIAGEHPFPEPPPDLDPLEAVRVMRRERNQRPVPSLRARCPDVPWSLDALAAQCLDPDPRRRYGSAGELAVDLRRFLADLPMKHCPEPSFRERAAKWVRRHPTLSSSGSVAAASVVLLGLLVGTVALVYDGMLELAARMRLQSLNREFVDCQFLLNVAGRNDELLRRGLRAAEALFDQVGMAGPDIAAGAGPIRRRAAARDRSARWISRLEPEEAQRVRRSLIELLVLAARGEVILAGRDGSEDVRRQALERAVSRLDQAERIDASLPPVLFGERARYLAALGDAEAAARDQARAREAASNGAQDLVLLGTSLLAGGDLAEAERVLRSAIARDVTSLWAWFAMGHCHFEMGKYLEAAGDFSACVARGPEYAWCHFNRGLALARAGRLLDAKPSFDRALELDPQLMEARVDRALVALALNQVEPALEDLRAAVDQGYRDVAVLSALGSTLGRLGRSEEAETLFRELLAQGRDEAAVRAARGLSRLERDPAGSEADFTAALQREPRQAMAHYGMARLVRRRDQRAALKHLDAALAADPNLIEAVELRALVRARQGDRSTLEDVERLARASSPQRLYNAACALAVYGEPRRDAALLDRAFELLTQAVRTGFPAQQAVSDPDLKPLRDRPEFARLTGE